MSLMTRSILNKLNESAEVKKTYGDKPQEGKTEKLTKGKSASIPKNKSEGKYKVDRLKTVNKEAGQIYANDTDKLMDKIDSKEQSDKGKVAKVNGKKSDKTIKFPFGDKVQQSDSKLIKESASCEGPAHKVAKELIENGKKYNFDAKADNITENVIKKVCSVNKISEVPNVKDVESCANELWESNTSKCNKSLKEDYDNGTWKKHQDVIENELEAAHEDMDEDAFLDFCKGISNLALDYGSACDSNKFENAKARSLKEDYSPVPTIASKQEISVEGLLELGYKKVVKLDDDIILNNGESTIVIESGETSYATKYDSSDNFVNFTEEEYNALKA